MNNQHCILWHVIMRFRYNLLLYLLCNLRMALHPPLPFLHSHSHTSIHHCCDSLARLPCVQVIRCLQLVPQPSPSRIQARLSCLSSRSPVLILVPPACLCPQLARVLPGLLPIQHPPMLLHSQGCFTLTPPSTPL